MVNSEKKTASAMIKGLSSLSSERAAMVEKMSEEFGYENLMRVPEIQSVIVTCTADPSDSNALKDVENNLFDITGQKPVVVKALKSISAFKTRAGQAMGYKVTLRGWMMQNFMKVLMIALPRTKDFRAYSVKQFDGRGNFSLGIKSNEIFYETKSESADYKPRGMNITIITSAKTDKEAQSLLKLWGIPFRD
jgi:large subunit ribosomal protein L5